MTREDEKRLAKLLAKHEVDIVILQKEIEELKAALACERAQT